jgi:hypothetical protein
MKEKVMQPNRQYCGKIRTRVSSENVWPLRGVDGLTYAERKAKQEKTQ